MANIQINDLNEEMEITEDEMKHVKGGVLIGLLLPAVQKVRTTSITDTTSYKVLGDTFTQKV